MRLEESGTVITGVERRGSGTPIILLHGAGGNALWFKPLMPALGASRVIALDMPGHGGSADAPSWEMEPLAELMFAASRRLVNGRVIWGGHSWGGKLAAMIAALHPETADGLLLLDPSPASCIPIPAETFVDVTFGSELGPWPSLEEAENSVRNLPQYSNWNEDLRRAFERGVATGPDGMLRARISRETLIAICAAAGKDYSDIIRAVSCPTLFVVATRVSPGRSKSTSHCFRMRRWAVIRSNHWLMSGNPAELNRAVESWLMAGEESVRVAR